MRKNALILAVALLALGYGGYTTFARVSAASPSIASQIALAEMLASAPGVIAGWIGDRKGLRFIAPIGLLSFLTSLLPVTPVTVFVTLSSFYASFLAVMIESSKDSRELGKAVSALSLGWGLGVIVIALNFPMLLINFSFLLGTILSIVSVSAEPSQSGLLAAVPKLLPLVPSLALFMGSEYLLYTLTAYRFAQLTSGLEFALFYAIGPSVTSSIGGYVAGRVIEKVRPHVVLIGVMVAYSILSLVILLTPPPVCLLAWSVPVYPFYEVSVISLVSSIAREAPASALGFTYTLMAISSVVALPFTEVNDIGTAAIGISIAISIAAVTFHWSFKRALTRTDSSSIGAHTSLHDPER
ncbi:hypothetical protein EYM_01850 [Ignicoccus islandicus DSM 13165]|uniref:Major facilitator superfamily (MFS) profile domain-containing protein n=1 Tax=Ignicoccus islandicus DSM 13165 TaxID=940295 RepID=A0A0U3FRZ0_9CREN|nr:hypothetical protein [Ignicoccus islandicus]ALU12256.1 hypothetical protein EYM_01850 [Ignicoccus islandicus DSM 13165]